MINLLLVWVSLPAMAQDVVHPEALLGRIAPIVAEVAPSRDILHGPRPTLTVEPTLVKSRPSKYSGASASLINPKLWDTLLPPAPGYLSWLSSRVQGLDMTQVRALPFSDINAIVLKASKQGENDISFLSDSGFTTPHIFCVYGADLAKLFAAYKFGSIIPDSGVSANGPPFDLQVMLLGNNRIEFLYSLDNFTVSVPGYSLILRDRVNFTIDGPGDLGVSGILARSLFVDATIEKIMNLGGGWSEIDTNWGNKRFHTQPIMPNASAPK